MDIKALRFEGRFSIAPNCLGYCGREEAGEKLRDCVINGNCSGVEEELKKFIVLYPYLKTIARITKLPVFSFPVIESYWLGNDLLKKVKKEHYGLLLENFKKQGVPDWLIKELMDRRPKKFIPNHLFQVLHVGVGRASDGVVPFNLESINNCMIRWGEVIKINNKKAEIKLNSLIKNVNKYSLKKENIVLPVDVKFVQNLKIKDSVAIHWNMIIKKLTIEEKEKLLFWTDEVINSLS